MRLTLGVVLLLCGCAPALTSVASRDLRCSEDRLYVTGHSGMPYTVTGCGRTATYVHDENCNATYLGKSCNEYWRRIGEVTDVTP